MVPIFKAVLCRQLVMFRPTDGLVNRYRGFWYLGRYLQVALLIKIDKWNELYVWLYYP